MVDGTGTRVARLARTRAAILTADCTFTVSEGVCYERTPSTFRYGGGSTTPMPSIPSEPPSPMPSIPSEPPSIPAIPRIVPVTDDVDELPPLVTREDIDSDSDDEDDEN
jgi:hypothetical protein